MNATFHWIRELPDVWESCRRDCISKRLESNYAVITIDVEGELLHFVEYAGKEDSKWAKLIVDNWRTSKDLPQRTHWVVYQNKAYYAIPPIADLLIDSVRRKLPPGVNFLINGG